MLNNFEIKCIKAIMHDLMIYGYPFCTFMSMDVAKCYTEEEMRTLWREVRTEMEEL